MRDVLRDVARGATEDARGPVIRGRQQLKDGELAESSWRMIVLVSVELCRQHLPNFPSCA